MPPYTSSVAASHVPTSGSTARIPADQQHQDGQIAYVELPKLLRQKRSVDRRQQHDGQPCREDWRLPVYGRAQPPKSKCHRGRSGCEATARAGGQPVHLDPATLGTRSLSTQTEQPTAENSKPGARVATAGSRPHPRPPARSTPAVLADRRSSAPQCREATAAQHISSRTGNSADRSIAVRPVRVPKRPQSPRRPRPAPPHPHVGAMRPRPQLPETATPPRNASPIFCVKNSGTTQVVPRLLPPLANRPLRL